MIAETEARNVPTPIAPLPFTSALGEALHRYLQKQGQQLIPLTFGNLPDLLPTDHNRRSVRLNRFVGRTIADRNLVEVPPAAHPTRTFLGGLAYMIVIGLTS
ncbi:hypothetical protein ACFQ1S_21540 [Kibdelosporangium lantanae]|uniref:Uncharacterized protein n=1 Tax=Kibdelosporangium lantanae TaxID=1497396 RepID=A0ABW3MD78_9PSEU